MKYDIDTIKEIDLKNIDKYRFNNSYVSCIILSRQSKIVLQKRGETWDSYPGFLSTFGGKIDKNEKPIDALVREIKEELGADINKNKVVTLSTYTEKCTNFKDLIYGYFWHDANNTITGCYEGEARYFSNIQQITKEKRIMDDVIFLLHKCEHLNLIKH